MKTRAKLAVILAAATLSISPAAFAQAPAAAPAAAKAKYSVAATPIVELIRNAPTKAVLAKHMSSLLQQIEDNIDMLPPDFTLETLTQYVQGQLSPETLKAIDADLAKL